MKENANWCFIWLLPLLSVFRNGELGDRDFCALCIQMSPCAHQRKWRVFNFPKYSFANIHLCQKIIARFAWISWTSIYFPWWLPFLSSPLLRQPTSWVTGHWNLAFPAVYQACGNHGLNQGQQRGPLWLFYSKGRPGSYWPDFYPILYFHNCKEVNTIGLSNWAWG